MAEDSEEPSVRKNLTFPLSFARRIEELKKKRGATSESEVMRSAVRLLDALNDPNCDVILRRKDDGTEQLVIIV